jgi:hypothetical protein
MHVVLALGDGATYLNVQVVYGIAGRPALNADFLTQVMEYSARLGNAPSVLAGDWNVDLDDRTALPACMEVPLQTGCLVDLDLLHSRITGQPPHAACAKASGTVTRIDTVLANQRTAAALLGVSAVAGCTLPSHVAVRYTLQLAAARQIVCKLRRLVDPKRQELTDESAEAVAQDAVASKMQAFTAALQDCDVDCAWGIWTAVAEATLHTVTRSVPTTGRGTATMLVTATATHP